MRDLALILQESSSRHKHLCPRQVLGARMALYASELLGLDLHRSDKRLLVTAETDGCAVDGLIAATGCHIGGRTLRILDFGKVAATFTDTSAGTSIRINPSRASRAQAFEYATQARNRWEAMVLGYQVMPLAELFTSQYVRLNAPVSEIISTPVRRIICEVCGEEIINGREINLDDSALCRTCTGQGYYRLDPGSTTLMASRDLQANHR